MELFRYLETTSRERKILLLIALDSLCIFLAFWFSFYLRLDSFDAILNLNNWVLLAVLIPFTIIALKKLRVYKSSIRTYSLRIIWQILASVSLSSLLFIAMLFLFNVSIHRTIPILFGILSFSYISGVRFVALFIHGHSVRKGKEKVIVYGCGQSGHELAIALIKGPMYDVVAFVDDDKEKQGTYVQGIKVLSVNDIAKHIPVVSKVLLALPSVSLKRRKEIISSLEPLKLQILSIPSMEDIISGKSKLSEVKEVGLNDLLGREPVAPHKELMNANITDKVVMVTGAGGSIGSELCRQIITQAPKKLILFELSEFCLYSIERELNEILTRSSAGTELFAILGTIQSQKKLEQIMCSYNVQTVYHAAAYKHVPLVENNIVEGVKNNIFGTLNTANSAITAGVETFVLISTDKAVRPTNFMGATKRVAELILQALANKQSNTKFCMVRFGNVLGSSGSVVPLFRKQIQNGGPVTLTHMDITRYFMTIPEASQLVIQAGAMCKGGDVFVLDMGESVKIKDLAIKMIHLSGFEVKDENNPRGDIEIQCVGLRPGEKLYEELLIGGDVSGTHHERIVVANEAMLDWDELVVYLERLDAAIETYSCGDIKEILLTLPTEFSPAGEISDLLWTQGNHEIKDRKAESDNVSFLSHS